MICLVIILVEFTCYFDNTVILCPTSVLGIERNRHCVYLNYGIFCHKAWKSFEKTGQNEFLR